MDFKDLRIESKLLMILNIIGLLLVQFGVKLDLAWYTETVELVVALLTAFGLVVSANNNPTTPGIDLFNKKK